MKMEWIEATVILSDDSKFNDVLKELVKPYIETCYKRFPSFSWHFFREPMLCWRLAVSNKEEIEFIKEELDNDLSTLEKGKGSLIKEHYFGAFLVKDKEYKGESELYGIDAWELCYKRWESGSNLSLLLCTTEPQKSLPFHYTRDIHLIENQMGFELSDAVTIYLKWLRTLMNCDDSYKPYIDTIQKLIVDTSRESKIKGI